MTNDRSNQKTLALYAGFASNDRLDGFSNNVGTAIKRPVQVTKLRNSEPSGEQLTDSLSSGEREG
jgi:hypothetical protein